MEADRSIITNSVPAAGDDKAEPEVRSDEMTIRDAVSSANLGELQGGALSWANQITGSQGEISAIMENQRQSILCRSFSATRQSFDGVTLFKGEICLVGERWLMRSFQPA